MPIMWNTVAPARPPTITASETVLHNAVSADSKLSGFLKSAATANQPVLLIVNDPSRSTQTRPVLATIAKQCARADLRTSPSKCVAKFNALVATGTHCFSPRERGEFEQATFAGCGLKVQSVTWHDATDRGSLADIAGVRMHRSLVESRFLLPIGSVEPHYFAGLTGPHKTVTIGCMSKEDIERNHSGAITTTSEILRLVGNPVHDGVVEILRRLESAGKVICAIGEIVCGDVVLRAAVGDPLDVLAKLSPTVHQIYVHQIPMPVALLRLRVPLPLGRNLYQAEKALKNNHLAVRDGGGIILEAVCHEGIGPDAFMDLLCDSSDYASAQKTIIQRGYHLDDHKAVKLRHLMDPTCRDVHITLVTPHVAQSDLVGTGIRVFSEVESALAWLSTVVTAPLARGLIIEDAGMVTVRPARA